MSSQMAHNNGGRKQLVNVVNGKKTKKSNSEKLKNDFHATIERLLGGGEIIKIFQRNQSPNVQNEVINLNSQKVNRVQSKEEISEWLIKFYEQVNVELMESNTSPPLDSEEGLINLKKLANKGDLPYQIVRILELLNTMNDILIRLRLLVTDKPNGWVKMYSEHIAEVKGITRKFEDCLTDLEDDIGKGVRPGYDAGKQIAINVKLKYAKLKRTFEIWNDLAKIFLEGDATAGRKGSIIVNSTQKENGSILHSAGIDEL